MRGTIALSIVDQAVISGTSLLISLALITAAEPAAFGRFALATACFFVLAGVQNALVGTLISTRSFRQADDLKAAMLRDLATVDLLVVAFGGAATGLLALAFGFDMAGAVASVAMVMAGLWRELARTVWMSDGEVRASAIMNAAAALATIPAIGALWFVAAPEVACLGGMAIGMAVAALALGPRLHRAPHAIGAAMRAYRRYWALTRWSLLGALSSEGKTRSYVFAVEAFRGTAAIGMVQAGRVLISPVALSAMAWGRAMRPRIAAHLRHGEQAEAMAIVRQGAVILTGLALAWCAALYLAWDLVEAAVFKGRYPGIGAIVALWSVFAAVSGPVLCLSTLFQAMERFRELALLQLGVTVGVVAAMMVLALPVALGSAVMVLVAGEIAIAGLLVAVPGLPGLAGKDAVR